MGKLIRWFFFGKKIIKDPKAATKEVSKEAVGGFFMLPLVILGLLGVIFSMWGFGVFGKSSIWILLVAALFFFLFFMVLMSKQYSAKLAAKISGSAYDTVVQNNKENNI